MQRTMLIYDTSYKCYHTIFLFFRFFLFCRSNNRKWEIWMIKRVPIKILCPVQLMEIFINCAKVYLVKCPKANIVKLQDSLIKCFQPISPAYWSEKKQLDETTLVIDGLSKNQFSISFSTLPLLKSNLQNLTILSQLLNLPSCNYSNYIVIYITNRRCQSWCTLR